jgi:hypothetical protein
MNTAEKFTIFYENMRLKSIWAATRMFAEEPVIKFYGARINGVQKVKITFEDMSEWEGTEDLPKLAREV